ncbi:MAG: hypothetical protein ACYDDI_15280 [Candidatus Acidiferrales bacterium]
MKWLGILLISPVWGAVSTQLFLQGWLAFIGVFIGLIGFVKGSVPRKDTALLMGVAAFQVVLFSLLLTAGFWLLTDWLPFGRTGAENIVYWVFAGLSALYMLPQVPTKIRKSWRNALVAGSLEAVA